MFQKACKIRRKRSLQFSGAVLKITRAAVFTIKNCRKKHQIPAERPIEVNLTRTCSSDQLVLGSWPGAACWRRSCPPRTPVPWWTMTGRCRRSSCKRGGGSVLWTWTKGHPEQRLRVTVSTPTMRKAWPGWLDRTCWTTAAVQVCRAELIHLQFNQAVLKITRAAVFTIKNCREKKPSNQLRLGSLPGAACSWSRSCPPPPRTPTPWWTTEWRCRRSSCWSLDCCLNCRI